MPTQTPGRGKTYFPDGAKVEVKRAQDVSYFDVGCILNTIQQTLNYDENVVQQANCEDSDTQIKNMTIAGGFTLTDLDLEGIERMGGGLFTRVVTPGVLITTLDNQTFAIASWTDMGRNSLIFLNNTPTPSENVVASPTTPPTLTSVTASTAGVLAVDDDYFLIADTSAISGYSIQFNTAGTAGVTTAESIVIVYTDVLPIDNETLEAGSSSVILSSFSMRVTHTDTNGKIRRIEMFRVNMNSGGFQFNFKGANEEGLEEMPLTYTARTDGTLEDGKQLFVWTVEEGAA
jgi:hypothetical protein